MKEVLETKQLVLANASFDLTFLRRFCGIRATRVFDVLVAEKVLLNGRSGSQTKGFFGLADTLNRWFGVELDKTEQKGDWGSAFLTNDQIDYAANDVRYLHDLALKQVEAIESAKLGRVLNLEMKLIPALVDMRVLGVRVDSDLLKRRIVELERATAYRDWETQPEAEILAGLKSGVNQGEFEKALSSGAVADCFHRLKTEPGAAMFLPSGRVHAIGAGNVILEIQQNSDTTYR